MPQTLTDSHTNALYNFGWAIKNTFVYVWSGLSYCYQSRVQLQYTSCVQTTAKITFHGGSGNIEKDS